jgi:tRNA pseudouridine55 synthase
MNLIISRLTKQRIPDRSTMNGEGIVLLVDKPTGWTSFDVVNKIRTAFHLKKVGHAGTLDPLATGLLIVCTGRQTTSVAKFAALEKEYLARMTLGKTSASFDTETEILSQADPSFVSAELLEKTLQTFVGKQRQVPPMYSAIKVAGRPLYRYARKGQTVEREPREIEVWKIELLGIAMPTVDLLIRCSKGTYVRSLIHDIGQRLGCGAVLSQLRRTAIGEYRVEDAFTIEELVQIESEQRLWLKTEHDSNVPA